MNEGIKEGDLVKLNNDEYVCKKVYRDEEEEQKEYVRKVIDDLKEKGIFPPSERMRNFLMSKMGEQKDQNGVDCVVKAWLVYCEIMCCDDCKKALKEKIEKTKKEVGEEGDE